MAKRSNGFQRRFGRKPPPLRRKTPPPKFPSSVILESGTLAQLSANKDYSKELSRYHWNLYSEFSHQRAVVQDQLFESLSRGAIGNYQFDHWQRAVKYAYSYTPLSTKGSLKFGGGRFNIGDIDPDRFPMFPALYLAEDKETALQETLGQQEKSGKLSAMEVALTNPQSISVVSVSGSLETILDLTKEGSLTEFLGVISKFTVSQQLRQEARRLNQLVPNAVRTEEILKLSLMDPLWRAFPQIVDVPANSQIFGQLVRSAQLCGVLYVSKFNGAKCLAIFPKNFNSTSSFIQLDDLAPDPKIVNRVDSNNWNEIEI